MRPGIFIITLKSILYYRKHILYQVIIIALLSAVITGSLMTGGSVKASLRKTVEERLGNTGMLISSGTRFYDPALVEKLNKKAGYNCTGMLEVNGSVQVLGAQKNTSRIKIYAAGNDFFLFHGDNTLSFKSGELIINKRLADHLKINLGDELIIRFNEISDIPADAPFALSGGEGISAVMRVGTILQSGSTASFSLSISQIAPMNIFISIPDLENIYGKSLKFNRLLTDKGSRGNISDITDLLKTVLEPSDIGLRTRFIKSTGEYEIISDRIFIDEEIIKETGRLIPSSSPVITYLANEIKTSSKSTPYSFVSGLPAGLYGNIPDGNGIYINTWLADDTGISEGDSVTLSWYSPDSLNHLIENSMPFKVEKVVAMEGIWADSLLMPEFPGISGSESCSQWDAGIPVKTSRIRNKDEDYWNRFRGTPKAFINYETAKKIWGSNFGPATSIRFSSKLSSEEISARLRGSLDPQVTGFIISDIMGESLRAADESVDFGSLFLSLGFFLIVAAIILLSFTISYYFDLKTNNIRVLYALGFRNRLIGKLLFAELLITAVTGCLAGVFSGYLVNVIITVALNSVWIGAVQTDTLQASFEAGPVISGFIISMLIIFGLMVARIRSYLKLLSSGEKRIRKPAITLQNTVILIISAVITTALVVLGETDKDQKILYSFAAGVMLLLTLILLIRHYLMRSGKRGLAMITDKKSLPAIYYSFNPSHAITPVLFIATGFFVFFITSVNRKSFDEKQHDRSSGTGGYTLWSETTIPVMDDMNLHGGRRLLGLDDDTLPSLSLIQMKKYAGDDASCLNLNHITAPPLLGVDAADFISSGAFSFTSVIHDDYLKSPWEFLEKNPERNTIYGIADQTVLDWGLKLKTGDTLVLRTENGQPLNIIIAGGLESSLFQGYVLIGKKNFIKYFPSVAGHSVFLAECEPGMSDYYKSILNDRLSGYGIETEKTTDRLLSFYRVTNTYLMVFGVFGGLGLIIGIAGLGFVLLRNYNHRKREYALMLSTGFSFKMIKRMIFSEQLIIITAGIVSGIISASVATLSSLKSNHEIPWLYLTAMIIAILITGIAAVLISLGTLKEESLVLALKKD